MSPTTGTPDPWYLATTPLATRPWLEWMHWTSAAIELLLVTLVWAMPGLDLPLDHIVWLLVADATAHGLVAWCLRGERVPPVLALAALILQMILLTALLELTGGPSNPFVVVYFFQIALAGLTFGRVAAGALGLVATASYAVLIYRHVHELVPTHHRLNDFPTHLFTIWLAGTVSAELMAYFVGRASSALLTRERALEAMRERAARSERLVSLTTLAAGAAHELSTPLATIALTARELERSLEGRATDDQWTDDARLIRSEVDRCRTILNQMSGRAGGSAADEPEVVDLALLLEDVRTRLANDRVTRFVVDLPAQIPPVLVPRAGLRQTILSLVSNAFDASVEPAASIALSVTATDSTFRIAVRDNGHGLTPDTMRRAGEPFFTTKEPGRGLGLGLFLARVFAERLGGSLSLESDNGTTAVLELPCRAASAHVS